MTQQIQELITWLTTSGILTTGVTIIVTAIVKAIANVKTRKYSKLTDADKSAIVNDVKSGVLSAIQGGVTVDMDAQLDKATARRITAVEKSQNEIVEAIAKLAEYQKVVLTAIGDFKTISQSSKEQIRSILKGVSVQLGKVDAVEQPVVEVRQSEQLTAPKDKTVSY